MHTGSTNNLHVESVRALIPPAILIEDVPLASEAQQNVNAARADISRILVGEDPRLVVVVGPCSIHDPIAALDYATRLRTLADELADALYIVMRVYFEKPRTTVGWKGLINDPHLDGSYAINQGLRIARTLLRDIVNRGLPAGCEFLDPISPQFITDLVAWGAIGARTTESQVHRELASGLSMPVGFKNGTDGNTQIAIEGVIAARHPHRFLGVSEQGLAAIVSTLGNSDCHIILRGGKSGPNYYAADVTAAASDLTKAGLPARLMIDASHGNSGKDPANQPNVLREVGAQLKGGSTAVLGVMLESFLVHGRQDLSDRDNLCYGQSITDACLGWEETAQALRTLAEDVRARPTSR